MAFTRRTVAGYGLTDEQLEKVMTLYATSLADYVPKADVQEQINKAVEDARKTAPAPNIKDSDEYKTLQGEFENYKRKVETSAELKAGGVKDKFLDNVYSLLDAAKPAAEQLEAIRTQYEEYFDIAEPETLAAPQFGAGVKGSMPTGKTSPSFSDYWSFGKQKGE
jgi:molecular chaperone GrpE (heat shock protein)